MSADTNVSPGYNIVSAMRNSSVGYAANSDCTGVSIMVALPPIFFFFFAFWEEGKKERGRDRECVCVREREREREEKENTHQSEKRRAGILQQH